MTTLISWAVYRAGQATRPNSIYITSDSRITWGSHTTYWDGGRKIFTCRVEPHMFGYCGDVVFPSLVVAQIVSAIDNGVLFESTTSAEEKHEIVYTSLKKSFERRRDTPDQDFSILHALRMSENATRLFAVWQVSYHSKQREWQSIPMPIPATTGLIAVLGSGKASVKKHIDRWTKSDVGARSSAFFSGFCDALFSAEDKYSGGMPQIGALNPGSHAQIIGFIDNDAHYLHGLEVVPMKTLHRIKWCDRHFQNINPSTLKRPAKARRLKRPSGL
jgi:hypothetical protein